MPTPLDTHLLAVLAPAALAVWRGCARIRRVPGRSSVVDARGASSRTRRVETAAPHPCTALGWPVDDLAATMRALAADGVAMGRLPGLAPDADGGSDTPAGARVAWFHHPDGKTALLHPPAGR